MILITEKLILNMGRNIQKLINAIKGLDAIVNISIGIGDAVVSFTWKFQKFHINNGLRIKSEKFGYISDSSVLTSAVG